MRISYVASAFCIVLATAEASAYTSVTGVSSGGRLTGGLLLQDTQYEADNNANFDVETTQLFVGYKMAMSPKFSLGASLGVVIDGELGSDLRADDGSGLRLGIDGQYEFMQWGPSAFLGTFALNHDRYSFDSNIPNGGDLDFTMTEIKIGGLFTHRINQFSLYGGLELYLYSNGEIDYGPGTTDAERDDRLNIRLGGAFAVTPSVDLRADLYLLTEQTLLLAADFRL